MADDDHKHRDRHAVHLALVQRLRGQAADVRRLTQGLDEVALATRSIPGKWSLKELVCHCRRMETIFGDRLRGMLASEDSTITPYDDPDGDEIFIAFTQQPTEEVLAEYLADRESLCRSLETLTPEQWHRKAIHPQYPRYDVHFAVEYMAHHEAHHIYQLFQRRVPFGKLPH